MRKVAVIGLGHVGATAAFILVTHGYADELLLLDKNEKKCAAEWGDLRDTLPRNDHYVKVNWSTWDDWSGLKDVDVIITAFGDVSATIKTGDRFAEFPINTANAKEVGPKIKESGFHGIIINISNPCDVVTSILQRETGLPRNQVFGTGTFWTRLECKESLAKSWAKTHATFPASTWANTAQANLLLGQRLTLTTRVLLTSSLKKKERKWTKQVRTTPSRSALARATPATLLPPAASA